MKSSKNFNVRSTGFDYTKQRSNESNNEVKNENIVYDNTFIGNDRNKPYGEEMVIVKRPIKKMNRFQK